MNYIQKMKFKEEARLSRSGPRKASTHISGNLLSLVRMSMTSGMHRRANGLTCLRLLSGHTTHVLGVQLYRVIAKFGLGSCLEIMTAHRKVAVPLHPPGKRTNSRDDGNTKAGKTRQHIKM